MGSSTVLRNYADVQMLAPVLTTCKGKALTLHQ